MSVLESYRGVSFCTKYHSSGEEQSGPGRKRPARSGRGPSRQPDDEERFDSIRRQHNAPPTIGGARTGAAAFVGQARRTWVGWRPSAWMGPQSESHCASAEPRAGAASCGVGVGSPRCCKNAERRRGVTRVWAAPAAAQASRQGSPMRASPSPRRTQSE